MKCGCKCECHQYEGEPEWPGPCAACCEPGDMCDCGRALAAAKLSRAIYPTKFTDPEYTKDFYETYYDEGTTGER